MNDPEIEAIDEPPPEYMDLANGIVAMRELFYLCGAQCGGYPILVSEDGFGLQEMEERIRRALASGQIRSFYLEGSEYIELPRPIWKNHTAWNAIRMGTQLRIAKNPKPCFAHS
jgi:hypothetical protein